MIKKIKNLKGSVLLIVLIAFLYSCETEQKINVSNYELKGIEAGVNENFLNLDTNTFKVKEFDLTNGIVKADVNTSKIQNVNLQNSIIYVDKDTMGYLRKVVSSTINGNTIEMKTEPAKMEEVFTDIEFKLSTKGNQVEYTGSTNFNNVYSKNNLALSRLLKDEQGVYHPYEIVTKYKDGTYKKTSYITNNIAKNVITKTRLFEKYVDLDEKYKMLVNKPQYKVFFESAYMSLYADGVTEFKFKNDKDINYGDENLKLNKSDMVYCIAYIEGTFESEIKAKFITEIEKSDSEDPKKIMSLIDRQTVKFLVGGVPIVVTYEMDLYRKWEYSMQAKMEATAGFKTKQTVKLGLKYTKATNSIDPITGYTPDNTIYPLTVSAEANLYGRFEIYPKITLLFYGVFGPYFELVPYVEANFNAKAYATVDYLGATSSFVGWNSGINLGLDSRVGTLLDFFFWENESDPVIINGGVLKLYEAPSDFSQITTPKEVYTNETETLSLKVLSKVINKLEMGSSFVPVFFSGDGTFKTKYVNGYQLTDISGNLSVPWTAPSTPGIKKVKFTLKKANEEIIKEEVVDIMVLESKFLNTDISKLEFSSSKDQSKTINITSNNSWTINNIPSWITVTKTSGENNATIEFITKSDNLSPLPRTDTVTIKSTGLADKKIILTQAGNSNLNLTLDKNTLQLSSSSGSTGSINITSSTEWTIKNVPSWLTCDKLTGSNNATITFTANSENTTSADRTASITISGTGVSDQTLTITQKGIITYNLSIDVTSLNFINQLNASNSIKITSNTSWSITEVPTWLNANKLTGSNNETITLTTNSLNTSSSARTATLKISGTGVSTIYTITLTQAGTANNLSISGSTSKTVDAYASTNNSFNIISNTSWTVTTNSSVIILKTTSGTNNGTVLFDMKVNPNATQGTELITITGGGLSQTFTVYHSARPKVNNVTPLSVVANSTNTFKVTGTNLKAGSVAHIDEIVISNIIVNSGGTEMTFTGVASKNFGNNKNGVIKNFSAVSVNCATDIDNPACPLTPTFYVNITQDPNTNKTLSVSPSSLTFLITSNNSNTITITSNTSWTISGVPTWINISSTSGSNNGTITLTTSSENTGTSSRSATLIVSGTGVSTTYSVNITQDGTFNGTVFTSDGFTFVNVEGGTFTMGCTSEQEQGSYCESDEKPSHSVTLSAYSIGKYEVTQAQWVSVMGSNPSYFQASNGQTACNDCPVEQVSWNDIQTFLTTLNTKTGKSYRLPTEAEWEYAARGGNKSQSYKYSGSNDVGSVAWYGNSSGKTHSIGTKTANELGIYDMSGNVYEWCSDWYVSNYYTSASVTNPTGPSSGTKRVLRGGSWDYFAHAARVSYRYLTSAPGYRFDFIGFRLVLP